jgi:hypothetical protein
MNLFSKKEYISLREAAAALPNFSEVKKNYLYIINRMILEMN